MEGKSVLNLEGWRLLFRFPLPSVVLSLTLGLALFGMVSSAWFVRALSESEGLFEGDLTLMASLEEGLGEAATRELMTRIAGMPMVKELRWLGQEEQLEAWEQTLGKELLEGLDEGVLPQEAMLEISLHFPALSKENELLAFHEGIQKMAGIQGLSSLPMDYRSVEIIQGAQKNGKRFFFLLTLGSLFWGISGFYLLLSLWRKTHEERLRLYLDFGATRAYIWAFFLWPTAVLALLSALLSSFLLLLFSPSLSQVLLLFHGLDMAPLSQPMNHLMLLLASFLLAFFGAFLALRKHLDPLKVDLKGVR